MEQNSQPINAQPINVQQPKKNDTGILIVVVIVIIALFGLSVFGIYYVSKTVFHAFIRSIDGPSNSEFAAYLYDKYGDGDEFSFVREEGSSMFETGSSSSIFHSKNYDRDFKVYSFRGDGSDFVIRDSYWLAQHGDDLDAHYRQLFDGIFDYDYTLQYTSNSSELDDSIVDLSTEELLKDHRLWITVKIVVAEKDVEGTALDIRALQSAMEGLRSDIPETKEVNYIVKSDDGRYPEICSAVNPGVKSSSSDYCSETLIFNYVE